MSSRADPLVALRRHASSAPWRARDLIDLANAMLRTADCPTERALTERTLHYYVTSRVVRPPTGRGAGTGWGYTHLIELLAARLDRRAGVALPKIAVRREHDGVEALERRVALALGEAIPAPPDSTPMATSGDIPLVWRDHPVSPTVVLRLEASHPLHDDPGRLGVLLDGLAREVALLTRET